MGRVERLFLYVWAGWLKLLLFLAKHPNPQEKNPPKNEPSDIDAKGRLQYFNQAWRRKKINKRAYLWAYTLKDTARITKPERGHEWCGRLSDRWDVIQWFWGWIYIQGVQDSSYHWCWLFRQWHICFWLRQMSSPLNGLKRGNSKK